ncbi:E3 ubiquitin-protein ligase RNF138-like isoform X1 [Oncorhynchus tshawytscha]|uniref:E3 ubiquitin-protein ligase RNF138 n=1 Tax=Oncorhynchus tshawytscha TaxID=74940 RepID=A0A8C8IT36_ONCTS|nr:E3 ubiquitin-protein ligase RNF138-like isoform X1 [Oncorhynchus tshawytscha]
MAHSAAGLHTPSEDECPICMSPLMDPHHPAACSHVFCRLCLSRSLKWLPHCPLCRVQAQADDIMPVGSTGVTVQTRTTVIRLDQPLSGLTRIYTPATRPVTGDIQSAAVRTFVCPICQERGLNEQDLVGHCNDNHHYNNGPVVCPVCVSLPHGNPNQISRNFIRHLNLRHCYYAEDYTNIHQTDTLNVQYAIIESLRDANLNPR